MLQLTRHGIVQNDLKPVNILVAADGEIRLSDFGLARSHDRAIPPQAGFASPDYGSSKGYVSGISDVFSLGVVIFSIFDAELHLRNRNASQRLQELKDSKAIAKFAKKVKKYPQPQQAKWNELLAFMQASLINDATQRSLAVRKLATYANYPEAVPPPSPLILKKLEIEEVAREVEVLASNPQNLNALAQKLIEVENISEILNRISNAQPRLAD